MNTAASPIKLQKGNQLSLGLRAIDPDGKSIRPSDFSAVLNGNPIPINQPNSSLNIQGAGPFYRVLWRPSEVGDYNLRIQVADTDGGRGISQTLAVSVAAGFEPTIKMVSPINEDVGYLTFEPQNKFSFPSTPVFTFEAKDFDGRIRNVKFFANSDLIGSWPDQDNADFNGTDTFRGITWREGETNRYSIAWGSLFPGDFSITASAEDDSGQINFAKITNISFVAPYKDGSLPPVSEIRYPENQLRREGDAFAVPAIRETPAFTSTSKFP